MFNFTTESIFNDLTRFSLLTGGTGGGEDPGVEATKKAIFVKRQNKFLVGGTKDYIVDTKVYKTPASAATYSTGTITVPSITVGAVYRIGVQLVTNNYPEARFARDRVYFGKPLYIEVLGVTDAATTATAFKTSWNKPSNNYVDFATADTTSAAITFTATNPYIKFGAITIEKIDTTTGDATIVATASATTVGNPGFGTWDFLVKNRRLLTIDNNRPLGEFQDELPTQGALYDQYTFTYSTDRGVMGTGFLGEEGRSTTTHVWYVKQGLTISAEIFDYWLIDAGLTVYDVAAGANITKP